MGNIEINGNKPLQVNINGQQLDLSVSQKVEPKVEPKVEQKVEPKVEPNVVIIDDLIDTVKLCDIDNYTAEQLIEYLKITRPEKKLVDNTFHDMVKNIDFENREIIPISIELYQKVKDVLFKYVAPVNKKKPKKKFHRYVAPKFNVEQIIKYNKINKETITDFLTLDPIPKPTIEFNTENITISEFDSAFKDPTLKIDMIGISKKMLQMLQQYHKLRIVNGYNKLWKGIIEPNFFGKVAYIFKENKPGATPTDIKFFRQIMVMPTIVKHFHRILTIRMANYIEKNNYIDTNIQKGGISVNSGCMQQIVKVKEVIKHANVNKKPACIMFLDLSNAYGNLNIDALTDIMGKYHMPDRMINYIKNYYKNFKYYAKSKIFDTKTLDWEGGLMQGCPMSSILFVLALNYILSHIDKKYKAECGYELENNSKFLLSAFVDDICIVANSIENLKKIYLDIKTKLDRLGLPLNLDKCAIIRINPITSKTTI
uniref:Reverse transcriptase n=1 Tax=Mimivirus LCMiAC02 TaxID=2506609 RepID=A0A4D5XEY4_9VIRU|nr:MAG: reverse transcriptase [Mimivirus LCMiAC02]